MPAIVNGYLTLPAHCPDMVVKSRARAILVPLVFYAVFGGASAYLVKYASEGKHGAVARAKFDKQSTTLAAELADLQDERERWVHRVNALRNKSSTATSSSRRRAVCSTASARTTW